MHVGLHMDPQLPSQTSGAQLSAGVAYQALSCLLKAHAAEQGVGSPAASPKSADYLLPVQQLLRQLARPWLADAVHIGFCVGEPRLVAAAGQAAADSHMQVSAAHWSQLTVHRTCFALRSYPARLLPVKESFFCMVQVH